MAGKEFTVRQYRHPALKQFADQQVRFAVQDRKASQLERAEQLLGDVVKTRKYPYQYVCYRITDFRPEIYPDLVVSGEDLLHDLRLFIEDLSNSANLHVESLDEPVLTVEEVSRRYRISTKTVNRWRERGLVSRRFVIEGRRRVVFLQSSVERFVQAHPAEVQRGAKFSQLTEEEKAEIIHRAKRLASVSTATLASISKRIAKAMKRSPETVRYTIRNHDRQHPESGVFPDMRGPLDEQSKQRIYKSFRRGVSIDELAEKFNRTRSTVYRIVNEIRAERLSSQPIEYMYHPSFDAPDAAAVILGAEPQPSSTRPPRAPSGLPAYLQSLYEIPLLTRDQEQYFFRKMNYLLYKAKKLQEEMENGRIKASALDQIEKYRDEALEIKRKLIRANLRLVVSIAKRHVTPSSNLFELISDGNVSLMRAVEKFDFSRGFKFSTYASWAIMKNFARTIPAENTRRDRFLTGQETAFELTPDARTDEHEIERSHQNRQSAIDRILNRLEERERNIIICRYGLDEQNGPQTLEQVGNRFGVTKERIRQIEARAITKLRQFASEEKLDLSVLQ